MGKKHTFVIPTHRRRERRIANSRTHWIHNKTASNKSIWQTVGHRMSLREDVRKTQLIPSSIIVCTCACVLCTYNVFTCMCVLLYVGRGPTMSVIRENAQVSVLAPALPLKQLLFAIHCCEHQGVGLKSSGDSSAAASPRLTIKKLGLKMYST